MLIMQWFDSTKFLEQKNSVLGSFILIIGSVALYPNKSLVYFPIFVTGPEKTGLIYKCITLRGWIKGKSRDIYI